ncbi:uncharacterized protein LOC144388831 [Gasterosteus aculeatus]
MESKASCSFHRYQDEKSEESEIAHFKEIINLPENHKDATYDYKSRMVSHYKGEMQKLYQENRKIRKEAYLLKTTNAELKIELAKKHHVVEEIRLLEDICLQMEKRRRGVFGKKMQNRDIELQKLKNKMLVERTSVFSDNLPNVVNLQGTREVLDNIKKGTKENDRGMFSHPKEEMEKLSEENLLIKREADLLKTTNTELMLKQRQSDKLADECLLAKRNTEIHLVRVNEAELIQTTKAGEKRHFRDKLNMGLAEKPQLVEEIRLLEDICLQMEETRRGIFGKKMQDRDIELQKLKTKMPVDKTTVFSDTGPKVANLQGTREVLDLAEKHQLVEEIRLLEELCLQMEKTRRGIFGKKMQDRDIELQKLRTKMLVDRTTVLDNINKATKENNRRMFPDQKEEMEKLRREADLLKTTNAELIFKLQQSDTLVAECLLTIEKRDADIHLIRVHEAELIQTIKAGEKRVFTEENMESAEKDQFVEEIRLLEDLCLQMEKRRRGIFGKSMQNRDIELQKLRTKMPGGRTCVFSNVLAEVANLQGTITFLDNLNKATKANNRRMFLDHREEIGKLSKENVTIRREADLLKTTNAELKVKQRQSDTLVAKGLLTIVNKDAEIHLVRMQLPELIQTTKGRENTHFTELSMGLGEKYQLVEDIRLLEDLCLQMEKERRDILGQEMENRDIELQKLRSKMPEVANLQGTIKLTEDLQHLNALVAKCRMETKTRDITIFNLMEEREVLIEEHTKTTTLLNDKIDELLYSTGVWKEKHANLEKEKQAMESSMKIMQSSRDILEKYYQKALEEYRVLQEEKLLLEEISLEMKEKRRNIFSKRRLGRNATLKRMKMKMREKQKK